MGEIHEGGANSVRRIEVGCHCWLSSWRRTPHPLRKDLPDFLTKWCIGTPPITVLLTILIREHGFEAAAMEVELDHISGGEAEGGQGGEKELIDALITGHANRTGSGPGWMCGDDHARAVSLLRSLALLHTQTGPGRSHFRDAQTAHRQARRDAL